MKGLTLNAEQQQQLESIYPYLKKIAKRVAVNLGYGWDSHLIEDMTSEAVLKASRSFTSYDPGRGVKFITYATEYIPAHLARYAHDIINRRGSYLTFQITDELLYEDIPEDRSFLEANPILLTGEYDIVRRYFGFDCEPESCTQIGEVIGRNREYVRRHINLLLLRLSKQLNMEF